MKYTAADAVIDAMDEAQRSGSTVQHVLAVEVAAIREDLEAVAVEAQGLERELDKAYDADYSLGNYHQDFLLAWQKLKEALARDGVRAVLEGIKSPNI